VNNFLDLLWLRIPPIHYVSPPVCEFEFSGSGSGTLVLVAAPSPVKVTGLRSEDCVLHWDPLPGACEGACTIAICYNVYRADSVNGEYSVVAECIHELQYPVIDQNSCFRVSAITLEGESDLSDAVCVGCGNTPPPPVEPESEIHKSVNGGVFAVTVIDGQTSNDPVLLLGTNSVLGGIQLNWDLSSTDTSGGMSPGDEWCYKVRGIVPTVGNFSNVGCAVRDKIFLGTGAVSYPTWQIAFGDLVSDDITLVTSLDLSGLRAVIGGSLFLDASFILTSLDLTNLIAISSEFHLSLTTITTLSLPNFTTLGGDLFFDNTSLVSVSMPVLVYKNGNTYAFDSSALDAASVEGILAQALDSGVTSASIFLDGGTNAPLSSLSIQGQADYAALVLAGNTVSINP
jgi:hypothetical protein